MAIDLFSLSDEEVLNLTPEQVAELESQSGSTEGNTEVEGEGEGQVASEAEGAAGTATAGAGDEGQADDDNEEGKGSVSGEGEDASDDTQAKPGVAPEGGTPVEGAVGKSSQTTEVKPAESGAIDYEAAYKKLTAPFTANGREMNVKDVDEAITLMQMGANYSKKMAALKPNLKLMRLLEANGLLDEEKINYLIDLDKKTPGAISKLVKDSGLDQWDLDAEKAEGYKPTSRTVDDKELELDEVLTELASTPSYQRTVGIVAQEWDAPSKRAVAENPQLLRVINEHVRSGVYDMIKAEVERERVFGRLQGISDIEAYRQVGDAIHARNGFAHLSTQGQQTQGAAQVVSPKPKQVNDEKLNEKRRAAAAAKPAVTTPKPAKDFNPLAMSDEDFAKEISKIL